MKVYRVEDFERGHGIWRNFDGTVNPVFQYLSDGKCKDMPMDYSDFYREDGKNWFSATDAPEKLKAWFSTQDIVEMEGLGYFVRQYEVSETRPVSEYEVVFTRQTISSAHTLDPSSIWEDYFKIKDQYLKNKILNGVELTSNEVYDIIMEDTGIEVIEAIFTSETRWSICEKVIIKIGDRHFSLGYYRGKTENQEDEYYSQIAGEVEQKEIVITKWVQKGDNNE